jgi:L-amino acid N-acyltransferase YncA
VARLSAEITTAIPAGAGRTGVVGHYEALAPEAGIALLRRARDDQFAAGAACVLGPMNGSPWARYRLVIAGHDAEPPFAGEPWSPPGYAEQFEAAGFTVAARYESRIARLPARARPGAPALARRLAARGIAVRSLAGTCIEAGGPLPEELGDLYDLSAAAFAGSPYYRPIDWESFRALYAPLRPALDPDLVLLARDGEGRLIGFLFAMPSFPGSGRLVLKTLAVGAQARRLGLGAHLADLLHARAKEKGYMAVIHALMHEANPSLKLSRRYGSERFREYALCRAVG